METKIKNLLSAKTIEREELNKTWEVTSGYSKVQNFSEKMDKLETEIDLLLELLKN